MRSFYNCVIVYYLQCLLSHSSHFSKLVAFSAPTLLRSFRMVICAYSVFSVADGVDHFKHGRLTEAMQMLNKALQIDADNVEALVARGAL